MPVKVNIPTRIRIDRQAAQAHGADIAAAVQAAIGRALEASRTTVLDKRGGYLPACLAAPEFNWSGEDLAQVPRATRLQVEAEVRRAIAAAARASGVLRAGDDQDIIEPLSEAPMERLDAERFDDLFEQYSIPSYEGGKKRIPTKSNKPAPPRSIGHSWRVMKLPELKSQLKAVIADLVRQWGVATPGSQVGFIAQIRGPKGMYWLVIVNSKPVSVFNFEKFVYYQYAKGKTPPFEIKTASPSPQMGSVTRWKLAVPGEAGLLTFIAERMTGTIDHEVRQARRKLHDETQKEHDDGVAAAVFTEVERRVKDVMHFAGEGKTVSSMLRVRMGNREVYLPVTEDIDATLHWEGDATLFPVSKEINVGSGSKGKGAGDSGGAKGGKAGGKPGGKGDGSGTGEGSGEGGGEGTGDEGDPGKGDGLLFMPENAPPPGEQGALFPPGEEGGITLECKPFDGEPAMTELGSDGQGLISAMKDIARRLQIPECMYAGNFCLNAAIAIGGRAGDISRLIGKENQAGFTRPSEGNSANFGAVQFAPVAAPSIRFLRHLSGVVPSVARMMRRTHEIYRMPAHRDKVKTQWDNVNSWILHFMFDFSPAMDDAVGYIFKATCQSMLLQLLLASKDGIDKRLKNFKEYGPIAERLLVTQLSGYVELSKLRDHLKNYKAATYIKEHGDSTPGRIITAVASVGPAGEWVAATQSLANAFIAVNDSRFSKGKEKEVVNVKGIERIRDSHGVLWSLEEIESAMVTQRGSAESIDPLIKQISDLPKLMDRFRENSADLQYELYRVLTEMKSNNAEMLGKVRESAHYAFDATTMPQEDYRQATIRGTTYMLGGIHDLAHQQIGEFFQGEVYYATGVDSIFSAEIGRKALIEALWMIEIIMLSVVCPPLGFLAGLQKADMDLERAHERERMFGALLDPELVITRAEVEMELFAARLGMALSLIPEAGTVAGAVVQGGKVALRAGLRMGSKAAVRFVGRKIAKQIMAAAAKDLVEQFVKEALTNLVMDKIFQKILEPILAHIEREAQVTGSVGGKQGAQNILAIFKEEKRKAGAP